MLQASTAVTEGRRGGRGDKLREEGKLGYTRKEKTLVQLMLSYTIRESSDMVAVL